MASYGSTRSNPGSKSICFWNKIKLNYVYIFLVVWLIVMNLQELYHEFHALDRFEQDYRRKIEELDSLSLPRKGLLQIIENWVLFIITIWQIVISSLAKLILLIIGESLMMFHSDLKHQRKLVRGLKKKSLWSKSLEEVLLKNISVVLKPNVLFNDTGMYTLLISSFLLQCLYRLLRSLLISWYSFIKRSSKHLEMAV